MREKRFATIGPVVPFTFLTNHAAVLLCIAADPRIRMRDIAATVGITERAAQRIVADLREAGYVVRRRSGRRNTYTVQTHLPVALPAERDIELQSLLSVLLPAGAAPAGGDELQAGAAH
jgi:hypothetical protein